MNRLDAMLARLPSVWRTEAGSLFHQVLSVAALALASFDEDMDRVQRSHWIDTAFDREDLERLGAMFDLPAAPWEPDRLYRERLQATVAARLRGAVTREAQEGAIVRILSGAQEALGIRWMALDPSAGTEGSVFHTGPTERADEPAFVEFPEALRRCPSLVAARGLLRPFDQHLLHNRGLGEAPLAGLLRGHPGGRTAVPVWINLTNGQVLGWAGKVACGQSLRLVPGPDGGVAAFLDGVDVSDRLLSGDGFDPDRARQSLRPHPSPRAITLARGPNRLWFFPLALYDAPGLGVTRLAMPGPTRATAAGVRTLGQGTFAAGDSPGPGTAWDAAVFHEDPVGVADLWWNERQPAAYRFEVPCGVVRRTAGRSPTPEVDRERVFGLLQQTVSMLRAAGVDGQVEARPLREVQRSQDRMRLAPAVERVPDGGGADALVALTALFDFTAAHAARFA